MPEDTTLIQNICNNASAGTEAGLRAKGIPRVCQIVELRSADGILINSV
jgi:hypothetical protein